ncbi:MAG: choice-of-anchor Q domain-containing protein [Promethearchaeota archaeon]
MKRLIIIFVIVVVISIATNLAQATIRNVPSVAYPTIQSAIDAAVNGDVVIVADGIYTGAGNRDIDFLGKAITVCSENGPENCIIDCQGSAGDEHRGFYFHSGETSLAVLDGFIVKNGYKHPGAGIFCSYSGPIIKNCKITENTAEWLNGTGGGCYFSNSYAGIINCQITFNSAIGTSTHSGNGWGGGIACESSTLKIKNTQINNNYGTWSSGGVGAGWNSSLYIENCVISHNSSQVNSGLSFWDCSATITNSTITENSSVFSSGGLFFGRSSAIVVNTILWGDSPEEIVLGEGGSISINYSDIQGGWPGAGNIDADPFFVDAANADYHLLLDSHCIDAGDNTAVTSGTDLDGNPRIVNGIVDIGAFEAQPPDPVQLLKELAQQVIDLNLNSGISNSLDAKLNAVMKAIDDVNDNNNVAAFNTLVAFIRAVEAQSGKQMTEVDADSLIAAVEVIIAMLQSE